jgi:hypothetical protein
MFFILSKIIKFDFSDLLEEKELLRLTNPDNIRVESNYRGPRMLLYRINKLDHFVLGIEGPITRKVFVDLIEAFQRGQVS